MKRRIISAVLVVCSILCMGLYQGTFAWFKAENEDVNSIIFTVADISIEVQWLLYFCTHRRIPPIVLSTL